MFAHAAGGVPCGRTRWTISETIASISKIWIAAPATCIAVKPKSHNANKMTNKAINIRYLWELVLQYLTAFS